MVPTHSAMSLHMCIDCRKLNQVIRKDYFPLLFLTWFLKELKVLNFIAF